MKYAIPKSVRIGKTKWSISPAPFSIRYIKGTAFYKAKAIHINKKDFMEKQQFETLWHELTHAILFDMGNVLAYDEKFVTEFSKRLAQAINTAEF